MDRYTQRRRADRTGNLLIAVWLALIVTAGGIFLAVTLKPAFDRASHALDAIAQPVRGARS
jgi:hypothetical protein